MIESDINSYAYNYLIQLKNKETTQGGITVINHRFLILTFQFSQMLNLQLLLVRKNYCLTEEI